MIRIGFALVVLAVVAVTPIALVWGFTCPVVIKQAEDTIRRAEPKANAETRPLLDEAKKYLTEAKAHHEKAKVKRDHGDAVRKAKFAIALAEEVIVLESP